MLLGLLPVACGALAAVAAVSLGHGIVHGVTLGFGTTLIGEAVDYSIYLFVQSERNRDDAWLVDFWPTIRLGVLTSVCGFAALLFSGFPGLAQLGLYSIAGLLAAAAITRFVLPGLLPARPPHPRPDSARTAPRPSDLPARDRCGRSPIAGRHRSRGTDLQA